MSDEMLNSTSRSWSEERTNDARPSESAREAANIMGVVTASESHSTPETTDSHSFESRRTESNLEISNADAAPSIQSEGQSEIENYEPHTSGVETRLTEHASTPEATVPVTSPSVAPLPNPGVVVDQAKQHAQKVIEQTQRTAGEAIGQARVRTTSWIETQLDQAADGLNRVAQTVRDTGEQLKAHDPQNMGQIAQFTGSAADAVVGVSTRLRDATVDEIYTETEKVARTQPGLFLGGAFVVGFLLARFLKSTGTGGSNPNNYAGGNFQKGYNGTSGQNDVSANNGSDRQLPVPMDAISTSGAPGPNPGF